MRAPMTDPDSPTTTGDPSPTSEAAVRIDHVGKTFRLPTERSNSLKSLIINHARGIRGYTDQQVLKDISFTVNKGDFFGIVGRNGSGKSTLLKIISQIYSPNQGSVEVNGKLVSFIELGVGFNPELTGRENVYLNGAMLGFSRREIDQMYDDIVDFAELQPFMNQKLKNYSSGMQVRLAFSVAIKAQGDILVLDEVLAVGDEAFQRKCNTYFEERKRTGLTTILVTHDMGAVQRYCNRAIMIQDGTIAQSGSPSEVANAYSLLNLAQLFSPAPEEDAEKPPATVSDPVITLVSPDVIGADQPVVFDITYTVTEDAPTYVAFSIIDVDRNFWLYNDNSLDTPTSGRGTFTYRYECRIPCVNQLKVRLHAVVRHLNDEDLAFSEDAQGPFFIIGDRHITSRSEKDSATGVLHRTGSWLLKSE